jgi:hypothetical protein
LSEASQNSLRNEAIVLIHGTFARGASWTTPDSTVVQALRTRSGCRSVHPFPWSGKNSHKARVQAGLELAHFVHNLCNNGDIQRIWCVTHSHGGNVALYALRHDAFKHRLAGIAFLGTPFLHIHRRNVFRFSWMIERLAASLIIVPAFVSVIGMTMYGAVFWAGITSYFWLMALSTLVGTSFYMWIWPRLVNWSSLRLMKFLVVKQSSLFDKLSLPIPTCPSYIAIVSRDEAASWLTAVDLLATTPWTIYHICIDAILGVIAPSIVIVVGKVVLDILGYPILDFSNGYNVFKLCLGLVAAALTAPFFIVPLVSAARGTRLAFGYEGLFAASTLRIRPSQYPFWRGNEVQVFRYHPNGNIRYRRHSSFYSDAKVIDQLTEWIRSRGERLAGPVVPAPDRQHATGHPFVLQRWVFIVASIVTMAGWAWLGFTN